MFSILAGFMEGRRISFEAPGTSFVFKGHHYITGPVLPCLQDARLAYASTGGANSDLPISPRTTYHTQGRGSSTKAAGSSKAAAATASAA